MVTDLTTQKICSELNKNKSTYFLLFKRLSISQNDRIFLGDQLHQFEVKYNASETFCVLVIANNTDSRMTEALKFLYTQYFNC
jgi:hypothetical protein